MMAIIRRNFGYKLVSVVIALLLYFIANNQQNPHTSNEVYMLPDVVGLPDDVVVRTAPAGFTATVSGPTAAVNAYKILATKATVDVSGARLGLNKLPITYKAPTTGDLDISGGPPYAEVTLEHKQRHEWFVDIINDNDPPPGYEYSEGNRIKVKVSGLPSEVARVARVIAPVPKAMGVGEIDENVSLVAQTESQQTVDTVQLDPPRAEVRITLKPASSSKIVILSASLRGQPAPGYVVAGYTFSPASVTVVGSRESLASRSSLTMNVDVNGLTKSQDTAVPVELPTGLALQDLHKASVTLHIDIRRLPVLPSATPSVPTPTPAGASAAGTQAPPPVAPPVLTAPVVPAEKP